MRAVAPADERPSDDRHWAFVAPPKDTISRLKSASVPPPGPAVIDAFVQERLAKEGLEQSPEAAPETLLRRLWLDLLGLPLAPRKWPRFVA